MHEQVVTMVGMTVYTPMYESPLDFNVIWDWYIVYPALHSCVVSQSILTDWYGDKVINYGTPCFYL